MRPITEISFHEGTPALKFFRWDAGTSRGVSIQFYTRADELRLDRVAEVTFHGADEASLAADLRRIAEALDAQKGGA